MIISLIGTWLLIVGTFSYVAESRQVVSDIVYPPSGSSSRLRVVEGKGTPANSAATNLQGANSLQNQNPSLQTPVGNQLQPNAGADALPKNY